MNGVGAASGGGSKVPTWSVGLVNSHGRYLTAETFGFKINADSANMRKKQLWTIEHDAQADDVIYLRSHLKRYLTCDNKGNVACDSEERDENTKFNIVYDGKGQGRWAFRSKNHGLYFGGSGDQLKCDTPQEFWTVRLAVHPHVNLRNVNRKRYASLSEDGSEIHIEKGTPWGADSLITIEFHDGKYAVRAANGLYLSNEGSLDSSISPARNLFNLEIKSGQFSGLAFKTADNKYLSSSGRPAVMRSATKPKGSITRDELFTLEDSHAQVFITASNGKKVSIKQGVDLTANQEDLTDRETFQVEYDKAAVGWRLRTTDNKYWSLETQQGIQANTQEERPNGVFMIEWLEDGRAAMKASNNNYLTAKKNGSLYATQTAASESEKFFITIINRPTLILRCDFGFVGVNQKSKRVECNKSSYDSFTIVNTDGTSADYNLRGADGKYWTVNTEGVLHADSADPQPFRLETTKQSRFRIRAPNGNYLRGENNGIMTASAGRDNATDWEY